MRTKIYLITALVSCLYTGTILAQTEASKKLSNFDYPGAIEAYQNIENKTYQDWCNLFSAYSKIALFEQAELAGLQMVNCTEATPKNYLDYALVLSANGKSEEAQGWLQKAENAHLIDSRLERNLSSSYSLIDEAVFENAKIDYCKFNNENQEYPSAFQNGNLIIASSKRISPFKNHIWIGNDKPFLNLFEVIDASQLKRISFPGSSKNHIGGLAMSEGGEVLLTQNTSKPNAEGRKNLELKYYQMEKGNAKFKGDFPFNDASYSVGHASFFNQGKSVVFASDKSGGVGAVDLYTCDKDEQGNWSAPKVMSHLINTEGNEVFPFVYNDRYLFFASDGHKGFGGLDIYVIDMQGGNEALNLGSAVNSSKDDFAFILDRSGTIGYFGSNRKGSDLDDDVYQITLDKAFELSSKRKVKVVDENGLMLSNTAIRIMDKSTGVDIELRTNDNGEIELPNTFGDFTAYSENYKSCVDCSFDKQSNQIVLSNMTLPLTIDIVDFQGNPIEIAVVEGSKMELSSDMVWSQVSKGQRSTSIPFNADTKQMDFVFVIKADGYFAQNIVVDLDAEDLADGIYRKVILQKIDKGINLASIIELNPIYFDYNKFNIREDAAAELDKIVNVLNQYPNMVIELGSHTDCRGTSESNRKLSDKRAKASANYIKSKISNPSRISGKGYGESVPVNSCNCDNATQPCTEEEYQQNRRTEFIVVSN